MQAVETKKDRGPRNGVDTPTLFATLDAVKGQPELAKFQFRASNRWVKGTNSRSRIESFTGAGGEHAAQARLRVRRRPPRPCSWAATSAPTPVEFLLHGLAACLTAGIANIAAARGVTLTEVESTVEGDIDLRGILGLSDEVRNGYQQIRVRVRDQGRRAGREAARDRRAVARPLRGVRRAHQRRPRRGRGERGLTATRRLSPAAPVAGGRPATRLGRSIPERSAEREERGPCGDTEAVVDRRRTGGARDEPLPRRARRRPRRPRARPRRRALAQRALGLAPPADARTGRAGCPGFRYQGPDPDGYMTMPEVVDYLERYARVVRRAGRGGHDRARGRSRRGRRLPGDDRPRRVAARRAS